MLANHPTVLGRAPTASSLQIGNVDGPADGISTDNALVRWNGTTGRLVQNGVVTEADYTGTLTGPTDQSTTTAVGLAFTNQPANDGIEVLSSNAGDTTQTVTIIGTTNGTDTVVVETVTLNGTTAVPTVKTDWGVVLAVKKSAVTLGTVTVREASADQTITAGLTAAVLSVGVTTVTNTAAYNQFVSMVADGATTKQFGFQGTNTAGTVIYDSQALTGTTAALTNSQFLTITELYRGDLEVARTVPVTTNGSWTLTGGAGATVSFDTLTGGLTLTPSGTGILTVAGGSTNGAVSTRGWWVNAAGAASASAGIFPNGGNLSLYGSNGVGATVTATQIILPSTNTLKFGATAGATIGVSADTTAGDLQISGTSSGGINLYHSGTKTFVSNSSGIRFLNGLNFAWSSDPGVASPDLALSRSAAGVVIVSNPAGGSGGILGGTGNFTITAGTGNSRTMALQTTTSGGVATTWVSANDTQDATFAGHINESTDTLSGAGAVSVTATTTKYTSTGGAQALTLADGTNGQIKRVIHDVDGGSGILTPTTKTGYTTVTFTNAGDSVSLQFVTSRGWIVTSSFGVTIA